MMLQPYLETVETKGELSVILFGGEVSHVVQKIPVPGDYRVQDDFGAADRPFHLDDRLIDLVQRTQPILGKDLLYARIDALENPNGDLMVNELELVEPSLFFRHGPDAAEKLAGLLHRRIAQV
jgi:glutathione synthase/RimK-type ligase-like ATP-grasp enzyme